MKNFIKIILLTITLSITLFAKDVATVTGVNGKATIERNGTQIEVVLGVTLQEKDSVITNKNAKVQIIFKDETIVTIGKNSNFSISEYLFEDGAEPSAKFSMLKGAMRTITGKIGKIAPEKFKVTAKTATIGIRGTNFSINITEVYCTFGAISITMNSKEHIVEQGFFITISPDGATDIRAFKPEELKKMKENFTNASAKIGTVNDKTMLVENTPLDNTTEDFDSMLIKDISNSSLDAEFIKKEMEDSALAANIEETVGLGDLLAGYTMSDASYSGTYTVTVNNNGPSSYLSLASGNATLDIDFGNDTIDLILEDSYGSALVQFNSNPSFSGTDFRVEQTTPVNGNYTGSATGSFNGASGQNVTGDFTAYFEGDENYYDKGTFDVSTTQELK